MIKTKSVSEVRENFAEYLTSLESDLAYRLSRRSKVAAYLVSPEYFEALLETIDELQDLLDMQAAVEDYQQGENIQDGEEVLRKLEL
jgi:PHD/YefM family antitoxin component YafN of YafNO toxin-antitoxin module